MKYGIYYNGYLKPTGGPNGYLYNLKKGYDFVNNQIDFLTLENPSFNYSTSKRESLLKRIIKQNKKMFCFVIEILFFKNSILQNKKLDKEKVFEYDCLHCHTVFDTYTLRYKMHYPGKIILTPHTPEPYSLEMRNHLRIEHKEVGYRFNLIYKISKYIEKKGYSAADGYIFPCQEAKEIYDEFPYFKKGSAGKKIKYLVTGLDYPKDSQVSEKKEPLRLLYVGRHNKIKGYDFLVEYYKNIVKEGIITIAGANEGIDFPKDDKWIELGWRTDVMNIIENNDIFILPNNNTYFDLIALEVMSRKRIILATDTGGNKYLSKKSDGVILFKKNNISDLIDKIRFIKSLDKEKYKEMQLENYKFIEKNCQLQIFAKNHQSLLCEFMTEWT